MENFFELSKQTNEIILPASRRQSMTSATSWVFLNKSYRLEEIGWRGHGCEKLWRYNQHYFDDLNAQKSFDRRTWHQHIIDLWIEENPPFKGDGWEPYPTSLRIVNWIKWAKIHNILSEVGNSSLLLQSRWLARRLEFHLLGNHLFSNIKALIFAGLYFEGDEADRWLELGMKILKTELEEQILADGGHFELSPMYHALALEDVLDLINIAPVRRRLAV